MEIVDTRAKAPNLRIQSSIAIASLVILVKHNRTLTRSSKRSSKGENTIMAITIVPQFHSRPMVSSKISVRSGRLCSLEA